MGSLEDRARMREQIAVTEFADRKRREDAITAPDEEADSQQDSRLPPPPTRSEDATSPGVIGRDDPEVDFYVSCQVGSLEEVKEYVESLQPPNMLRQYGLEQASFADHPVVVHYLLESGATLHGNVFLHSHSMQKSKFSETEYVNKKSIFKDLEGSQDIIALLEVFLDAGWHPNQPWHYPQSKGVCGLIEHINGNKLVKYLVERLPDLRFALGHGRLIGAIRTLDTEFLDLLLSHGADATVGTPLFDLVERQRSEMERNLRVPIGGTRPPLSFSQRRATAEWLLQHGVRFNDVDKMPSRDITRPWSVWEDETALSLARTGSLQSGCSRTAQTLSYSKGGH